jgi:hypothetical protein
MNSTGGYFELELRKGKEFHPKAIALNTGRNALELILKVKKYKKVYIPYYTCDVILEPFKKTKTPYEFYSIDKDFEPVFDYSILKQKEGFLYTNYFGLKDSFISELVKNCKNLIVDNSQSFFSLPEKGVPTFYSCRKFFGVPDGAYLYLDNVSNIDFPLDHSEKRFAHLLKRIEYGANVGYKDFKANDNNLTGQPIKKMSNLTKALLCNIDYEFIKKKRRENFLFLHKKISKYNKLRINMTKKSVPMVYPFLTNQSNLRQKLIENNIYTATYWSNVIKWVKKDSLEYKYTKQIVSLPIDQRYNIDYLLTIIKNIK